MRPRPASARLLTAARAALFPLCLGALALNGGCSKSPEPPAVVAEDLSPVKAPDGLLADLVLPAPDATWAKARAIVGGPAAFMPQGFGALAATLLRLPITASAEIDDKMPALGAILKKPGESYGAAIGLHVKAGDRFVDQLTKGPEARFVEKRDEISRVRVLSPKDAPATGAPFVIGVLGNYLLVAQNAADLHAAGPYVARTLPSRPVPAEDAVLDFPESALTGPIAQAVKKQWGAAREGIEGASAPAMPFTSTVDTVLSVLTDARHARLAVDLGTETVKARFLLEPKAGNGPAAKALAEMAVGDAGALLGLPSNALVGITWRDSAEARATAIEAQAAAVAKMLGKDTSAEDKAAISAAFQAEAAMRGDWVALGIALEPTGPSAMVRAPIGDAAKMDKALKQLFDLAKLPSAKARLAEASLAISTGKTVVENLPGDVQRVRFERLDKKDGAKGDNGKDDKGKAEGAKKDKGDRRAQAGKAAEGATPPPIPTTIDLLYLLTQDTLFGTVGYEPREALFRLIKSSDESRLGGDPAIKSAVASLGNESSFALVLDPIRIVAARASKPAPPGSAPLILSVGKTGTPAVLTGKLDVATVAIQELVKHRGAF
jgi:hypothetical protein